jgi:MFS family permease
MTDLPPLMLDQRKIDAEHMKLLSIFHFVMAGLALIGLGFLFLHWLMMHAMLDNPEMWKGQSGSPPPKQFFAAFRWFYAFFGSAIILAAVANGVSGWLIRRRRARVFSLVVAGLNCMGMPFGTILGVFTFMVLLRDSVAELYEAAARPQPGNAPVQSPQ